MIPSSRKPSAYGWHAVTRDEQAARAARTIEDILVQSHRRDQEVAAETRRVAAAGRAHAQGVSVPSVTYNHRQRRSMAASSMS